MRIRPHMGIYKLNSSTRKDTPCFIACLVNLQKEFAGAIIQVTLANKMDVCELRAVRWDLSEIAVDILQT